MLARSASLCASHAPCPHTSPQTEGPLGISLQGLLALVDAHGGRAAFEGKSTTWVKLNVVLPSTFSDKTSYVAPLAAAGSPHVAPATAMICHAYDDEFLGVLDAVAALEAREGTPLIYYFDLLVVNQHGQSAVVPFEVLQDEFEGCVRAIGRTLLVLRWANPTPLQRAWCVHELYTTLVVGVELKVLMPPEDAKAFRKELERDFDSLVYKTCNVDVEKASAREASDLANIQRVIREAGGFLWINQLVIGAMQSWMVEEGRAALAAMVGERGTSALINNLGMLLSDQGKLGEAEPLYLEALAARRRTLGNEHPDTLLSTIGLANLLEAQGKLGEAGPLFLDALAARRRTLGNEHPDTLRSINCLANLLKAQGKLGEAEPLILEAVSVSRRTLGDEHPDTLASINNLANLLSTQGKLGEAEPLYLKALAERRRTLGNQHPSTLASINGLANLLMAQGKLSEAEPLYLEALAERRRTLGNEHPDTLRSIDGLAHLLKAMGKQGEAEPLFLEAVSVTRRALGDENPDTLSSIYGLASLLSDQGKYGDAELLFLEALSAQRRTLGNEHPSTLASINGLADLLMAQSKLGEAESLFLEALSARRRTLGNAHPDTLRSINGLAHLLKAQCKLSDAGPLFLEALDLSRRTRGNEHPGTLAFELDHGVCLLGIGRFPDSEMTLRHCSGLLLQAFPSSHPQCLAATEALGQTLAAQGRHADAIDVLEKNVAAQLAGGLSEGKSLRSATLHLAASLEALGFHAEALKRLLFVLQGERERDGPAAQELRERCLHHASAWGAALSSRCATVPSGTAATTQEASALADAYVELERYPEAAVLYRQVHSSLKPLRGELDDECLAALTSLVQLSGRVHLDDYASLARTLLSNLIDKRSLLDRRASSLFFGRYELEPGPIVHGSRTSVVVRAHELDGEHRTVALKFMRASEQYDSEVLARSRDILVASEPGSPLAAEPSIVPVLWHRNTDSFLPSTESGRAARRALQERFPEQFPPDAAPPPALSMIVLPWAEKNLCDIIITESSSPIWLQQAQKYFTRIAQLLTPLHALRLTHGDVKPRNIVRLCASGSATGRLHLIDLDASRSFGAAIGSKLSTGFSPPEALAKGPPCPSPPEGFLCDCESHTRLCSHSSCGPGILHWRRSSTLHSRDASLPRPLPAHPAFDVWGLGCTLYHMLSGVTLFPIEDRTDNLRDPGRDEGLLESWPEGALAERLERLPRGAEGARSLLQLMLARNPENRPSLGVVLAHPYVTGYLYDVFISYRQSPGDKQYALQLRDALTRLRLTVFLDQMDLVTGDPEGWQRAFCTSMARSRVVVPIVSPDTLMHREAGTGLGSWCALTEAVAGEADSKYCDNVLLEWRLAFELLQRRQLGSIASVLRTGLSLGGTVMPALAVQAVEGTLVQRMADLRLGQPLGRDCSLLSDMWSSITRTQCAFDRA